MALSCEGPVAETVNSQDLDFSDLKVLLVEDQAFQRRIAVMILRKLGVEQIVEAENGLAALGALKAEKEPFHIVICDLRMPQMDGIQFIRLLGGLGHGIDVIVLSEMDQKVLATVSDIAPAYGVNLLSVLEKPLRPEALESALAKRTALSDQANSDGSAAAGGTAEQSITKSDIQSGIKQDEFHLYFQPKVNVRTGEMVGVEALARWRRGNGQQVSPVDFIAAAETFGLIDDLTDIIFVKAFRQLYIWRQQGVDLTMSVNLSVKSCARIDLPERLGDICAQERIETKWVTIELTETQAIEDLVKALDVLARLRLMGFGLSIDDFGTGHSTMQQLQRMPFSELKIDRAFVTNAGGNTERHALLEASLRMAQQLGLESVGEGVESRADLELLAQLGCNVAQGFFISKPFPAEHAIEAARLWKANLHA